MSRTVAGAGWRRSSESIRDAPKLVVPPPLMPGLPPALPLPSDITQLYVDLDGVLADFDRAVTEHLGRAPDDLKAKEMWPPLGAMKYPGFFASLPPMSDAIDLWAFVASYRPIILSGVPYGAWAPPQKQLWVKSVLGEGVPLITCMAREKSRYAKPGAILIDDNIDRAEEWAAKGGHFIFHTSAAETIKELKKLGFP